MSKYENKGLVNTEDTVWNKIYKCTAWSCEDDNGNRLSTTTCRTLEYKSQNENTAEQISQEQQLDVQYLSNAVQSTISNEYNAVFQCIHSQKVH